MYVLHTVLGQVSHSFNIKILYWQYYCPLISLSLSNDRAQKIAFIAHLCLNMLKVAKAVFMKSLSQVLSSVINCAKECKRLQLHITSTVKSSFQYSKPWVLTLLFSDSRMGISCSRQEFHQWHYRRNHRNRSHNENQWYCEHSSVKNIQSFT